MAAAVMRAAKLAGMGSVAASLAHCFRERQTDNADPDKLADNEHYGARSTDEAMARLKTLLPEKRRKDAVLLVEYVMTANGEWWKSKAADEQAEFFKSSLKWLEKKYGKDRIITASVHRDEKTPHLSAFVVPLTTDGRLSAKEFIGDRQKMSDDQTSYAAAVAHLDLSRGIKGSKARHRTIQQHYAALAQPVKQPRITAEHLEPRETGEKWLGLAKKELPEEVADRLTVGVQRAYKPTVARAREYDEEKARRLAAEATAVGVATELDELKATFAKPLELGRRSLAAYATIMNAIDKTAGDMLAAIDRKAAEAEEKRLAAAEAERQRQKAPQRPRIDLSALDPNNARHKPPQSTPERDDGPSQG